jgi:DNA-binding beta-propeller fold protein YncE
MAVVNSAEEAEQKVIETIKNVTIEKVVPPMMVLINDVNTRCYVVHIHKTNVVYVVQENGSVMESSAFWNLYPPTHRYPYHGDPAGDLGK